MKWKSYTWRDRRTRSSILSKNDRVRIEVSFNSSKGDFTAAVVNGVNKPPQPAIQCKVSRSSRLPDSRQVFCSPMPQRCHQRMTETRLDLINRKQIAGFITVVGAGTMGSEAVPKFGFESFPNVLPADRSGDRIVNLSTLISAGDTANFRSVTAHRVIAVTVLGTVK